MRALLVEDDVRMAAALRRGLRAEGVVTDVARSGSDALWMAEATAFDAVVLDLMLPEMDGFEVCRKLRDAGVWVPIIMLTARDAVEDRVRGLDAGADDYLTKLRTPVAVLKARDRGGAEERLLRSRRGRVAEGGAGGVRPARAAGG